MVEDVIVVFNAIKFHVQIIFFDNDANSYFGSFYAGLANKQTIIVLHTSDFNIGDQNLRDKKMYAKYL